MELENALYMMPVPISDGPLNAVLPQENLTVLNQIRFFIVENLRTARRFLKKANPAVDISSLIFFELNGHTPEDEISGFLEPLRKGEPMAVMSEAGVPGVADPGAGVARIAQAEGLRVIPLVGPSSILLSLMASGLNGQRFAFHGYLPVESSQRDRCIKDLENKSRKEGATQIFIETPYRNQKMFDSLLRNLSGETYLCIASDITNKDTEKIVTRKVKAWRNSGFMVPKIPTIFLFCCLNP